MMTGSSSWSRWVTKLQTGDSFPALRTKLHLSPQLSCSSVPLWTSSRKVILVLFSCSPALENFSIVSQFLFLRSVFSHRPICLFFKTNKQKNYFHRNLQHSVGQYLPYLSNEVTLGLVLFWLYNTLCLFLTLKYLNILKNCKSSCLKLAGVWFFLIITRNLIALRNWFIDPRQKLLQMYCIFFKSAWQTSVPRAGSKPFPFLSSPILGGVCSLEGRSCSR